MTAFRNRRTGKITAAPRIAVHFWPVPRARLEHFPAGARFPCGAVAELPNLATNVPTEVRCRNCIRAELVQALLIAGESAAHFAPAALRAWGLIPWESEP